jgi:uncharacterized protein DUF2796
MRTATIAALALTLALGLAAESSTAVAHKRELGAHEHGRGTLNMALEGNRLTMELEVPGFDIVGFEHMPTSRKDKAAVDNARNKLANPLALFKLPASAGCVVKEASAAFEADDHGQDRTGGGKDKAAKSSKPGAEHAQFHAQYALDCSAPGNITTIEFDYFRMFAGAQKLEVNLIAAKGQHKLEVTRARPRLDLAGKV